MVGGRLERGQQPEPRLIAQLRNGVLPLGGSSLVLGGTLSQKNATQWHSSGKYQPGKAEVDAVGF